MLRRRRKVPPNLRLICAPACLPHPEKVTSGHRGCVKQDRGFGGEDAYFIAQGDPPQRTHPVGRDATQPSTAALVTRQPSTAALVTRQNVNGSGEGGQRR